MKYYKSKIWRWQQKEKNQNHNGLAGSFTRLNYLFYVWVLRGIQLLEESRLPLAHHIPVASITVFVFSTRPWQWQGGKFGLQECVNKRWSGTILRTWDSHGHFQYSVLYVHHNLFVQLMLLEIDGLLLWQPELPSQDFYIVMHYNSPQR